MITVLFPMSTHTHTHTLTHTHTHTGQSLCMTMSTLPVLPQMPSLLSQGITKTAQSPQPQTPTQAVLENPVTSADPLHQFPSLKMATQVPHWHHLFRCRDLILPLMVPSQDFTKLRMEVVLRALHILHPSRKVTLTINYKKRDCTPHLYHPAKKSTPARVPYIRQQSPSLSLTLTQTKNWATQSTNWKQKSCPTRWRSLSFLKINTQLRLSRLKTQSRTWIPSTLRKKWKRSLPFYPLLPFLVPGGMHRHPRSCP